MGLVEGLLRDAPLTAFLDRLSSRKPMFCSVVDYTVISSPLARLGLDSNYSCHSNWGDIGALGAVCVAPFKPIY